MTESSNIPGFIGWIGNIERNNYSKCYISCLSNQSLDKGYHDFVSNFKVEIVKISPKESIKESFFNQHRSFSYFYSHKEFELHPITTGFSLEDMLNFIPTDELERFILDESKQFELQNTLIHKFCASYRGYYCRSMIVTRPPIHTVATDYEDNHKRILMEKVMTFGPPKYFLYEEVGIQNVPTGSIDIISCEDNQEGAMNAVAFKVAGNNANAMGENPQIKSNVISTSTKSGCTYEDPGSDRQVVVELLAMSSVLCLYNEQIHYVIMLKAMVHKYRLYLYFPFHDVLIRLDKDIPFEVDMTTDSSDRSCWVHLYFFIATSCSKPIFY